MAYVERALILARLARGTDPDPVLDVLASARDDDVLRLRLDSLVFNLASCDFPAARLVYRKTLTDSWRYRAARDVAHLGLECSLLDLRGQITPALLRAMADDSALLTIITGPGAIPWSCRPSCAAEFEAGLAGRCRFLPWQSGSLPVLASLCLRVLDLQITRPSQPPLVAVVPPRYSPLLALLNPGLAKDPLAGARAKGGLAVYHLGATSLDHLLDAYHLAGAVGAEVAIFRYLLTARDKLLDAADLGRLTACRDDRARGRVAVAAAEALFTHSVTKGWGARFVAPPDGIVLQAATIADIARGDFSAASRHLRQADGRHDTLAPLAVCLALAGRRIDAMKAVGDLRVAGAFEGDLVDRMVRSCFE